MKHLVLGGARSGKSRFAEQWAMQRAQARGKQLIYIATAEAGDAEMARRIAHHRRGRGTQWQQTIEEPLALDRALARADSAGHCIVVDCLTLWLSNCLVDEQAPWSARRTAFLAQLEQLSADIALVSNEVGSGIVPLGELSRRFADEAGWLHQALAERCEQVTLVCAGLPLSLKNTAPPDEDSQ